MAKKVKSKASKTITKLVSIVLIILSIVLLSDVLKNIYSMFKLQKQKEIVEAELQALKDENASLISTKEKLEDPDYIETYARGEYMFSKADEKVFYLPGE